VGAARLADEPEKNRGGDPSNARRLFVTLPRIDAGIVSGIVRGGAIPAVVHLVASPLVGFMSSDGTAHTRSDPAVMPGKMARRTADHGAFQTTGRICGSGNERHRYHRQSRRRDHNRFHGVSFCVTAASTATTPSPTITAGSKSHSRLKGAKATVDPADILAQAGSNAARNALNNWGGQLIERHNPFVARITALLGWR